MRNDLWKNDLNFWPQRASHIRRLSCDRARAVHFAVWNGNCLLLHEIKFISGYVVCFSHFFPSILYLCVSFIVLGTHKLNSLNKYGDVYFFTGAFQFEIFLFISFRLFITFKCFFFVFSASFCSFAKTAIVELNRWPLENYDCCKSY